MAIINQLQKFWAENKFLDKSSGVMAGPLNMSNNKITHLATATANGDAVDFEFFNKYSIPGSRIRHNILVELLL